MSCEHTYHRRIYYHDTDCAGVVYYANYLKYLEEARTEMLTDRGVSMKELALRGLGFAVAKVDIEYKAPSRYQDMLTIVSKINRIRLSAIQLAQSVYRDRTLIAESSVILVLVGTDFSPLKIPEEIKKALL